MNISKILSYVVLAVGAAGIGLWLMMNSAFSEIEAAGTAFLDPNTGVAAPEADSAVSPLYGLTLVIFILVLAVTLFSVFNSLAKNPAGLKKALIGIGAFLLVAGICYVLAEGVETPLRDGGVVSVGESKWIGAGLYGFYLLAASAVGLMLLSGVKKIIGK